MWEQAPFRYDFIEQLPGDTVPVNRPRQVTGACYSLVQPTPIKGAKFLAWSSELSRELGMAEPDDHALALLSGNRVTANMRPYALCYGGHQFGHWAGQLGDGRALCLGEWLDARGRPWEIQLKGAGRTPYSRQGDGRAVLRSSIREFLCSEAMHHLRIPTTRALSLVTTEEKVLRDMFYDGHPEWETAAIVTRVAPSFVRFGNFELLASRGEDALLKRLADFIINRYFPELDLGDPQVYGLWFAEIARRTAIMIAEWQRVGFVHGVMNTDNMSILGITIDYGPYGWLDVYDPEWTPNTTDAQRRRYRFAQQPSIGHWNLGQLGVALQSLIPSPEVVEDGLEQYRQTFTESFLDRMAAKLGLRQLLDDAGKKLYADLNTLMVATEIDMTLFFRSLMKLPLEADAELPADLGPLRAAFYQSDLSQAQRESWRSWLLRWQARARAEGLQANDRWELMHRANPVYVLRNYLSQLAIDAADQGDPSKLLRLHEVLRNPYEERSEHEDLAHRRPEWARHKAGCSALSCSS